MTEIIHLPEWPSSRPAPVQQPSFLPFDGNDPSAGEVHTVLPPEQSIPPDYDINWWRGDAWGVNLDETPPLVPGCNTTPATMIMSYLAPLYPRVWLDKILTAHAIRNYSHFHLDRPTWLAAGLTDAQAVDLIAYIQSWGFFTSAWKMGTGLPSANWTAYQPWAEPLADLIEKAGLADKHVWVVGEELNSYVVYGEDGLDTIIRNLCARRSFKVAGHFTMNYPGCFGGDVRDEVGWYQKLSALGYWGTLWQANPDDSAGAQNAHHWDTRKYMGAADPHLKCPAFELVGNAQLYGRLDEAAGKRRGWQSIAATRNDDVTPAVAGAGNGLSYPDGRPL